jgi:predicted NUDIX family NTP pyrophosphohydrolase
MGKQSAGLLFFKKKKNKLEVMLGHPGGPLYTKKDEGIWSIPKGEYEENENPLEAAIRETEEETGTRANGKFIELRPVKLKSGKIIRAWAVEADMDTGSIQSNSFSMEWPPHSGKQQKFPELDKAAWFPLEEAKLKIHPGQIPLLIELEEITHQK